MAKTVELIGKNIRYLRDAKHFSQKEVCADTDVPQVRYSCIENGKEESFTSTLEKSASVFEEDIAVFFRTDELEQGLNLPLTQKNKMIGLASVNKQMKDNLQTIIAP